MGFVGWLLGRGGSPANEPKNGLVSLDELQDEVVFMSWCASEDACPTCQAMDGMVLLPDSPVHAPHPGCTSPTGCTCFETMVLSREAVPRDRGLEAYIRANGGMITSEMHDSFEQGRQAADPKHQASDMQHASSAITAEAHDAEAAQELPRAAELYRESIRLDLAAAELVPGDPWRLRDMPYLFNRLTLVLERLKRYEDALAAIGEFDSLGLPADDAISKRRARISKRLGPSE